MFNLCLIMFNYVYNLDFFDRNQPCNKDGRAPEQKNAGWRL